MNVTFGDMLRDHRTRAGLSIHALAERCGIDFTYLSKIETGDMPPPSETIIESFCIELKMSVYVADDLFRRSGRIRADLHKIIVSSTYAMNLMRAIEPLSDSEVLWLCRMAIDIRTTNENANK